MLLKSANYNSMLNILPKLFLLFAIVSCGGSKKEYNPNILFNQKYGKKIEKIKSVRKEPEALKNQIYYSRTPTRQEIARSYNGKLYNNYRYVEVNEYSVVDEDIVDQMARSGQINPKIFEVSYHVNNHGPFKDEDNLFSTIFIPSKDAFGINTKFSDKSYLLVGSKSLQKNVDDISKTRSSQDIINSKRLIKDRVELRRKQKMEQIFGDI